MTQTQQGLKSLREKFNLEVAEERCEFLNQCYPLINDWNGPLPNLRDIFQPEEVDSLLSESIKSMPIKEVKRFVDFVASTGYKDEPPKVDKDGHEPPSRTRTTPLHHAARQDSSHCYLNPICIGLFEVYNERRVNYTDEDGLSHFLVACKHGCDKAVAEFLELAGHDQVDPNRAVPETGDSPLHLLLGRNRKELAESLLRRGADPNAVNKAGNTPLHAMCSGWNNFDTASLFFEIVDVLGLSVRLDARDELGNTALHFALRCSDKETVLLLLKRGADPSLVNDYGMTCLHRICQRHRRDDLDEAFFDVCDEKNIEAWIDARDKLGRTPLHEAVHYSLGTTIELLLRRGANPNLADAKGSTILHFYVRRHAALDLARTIFENISESYKPGPINVRDESGNTPLHLALKIGERALAELLMKKGADLSLANEEGSTPLHVIGRVYKISTILLVKEFFETVDEINAPLQPQVDARDNEGRTPLQLAVRNFMPDLADKLLDHGADLSSFVFPNESFFAESWLDLKSRPEANYNCKWRLASGALAIVEHLENRGYELDRSDALTIMKLFARYELLEAPLEYLGERWDDDESFVDKIKGIRIFPRIEFYFYEYQEFRRELDETLTSPSLSLYDLTVWPFEETGQLLTYAGFHEYACLNALMTKIRESENERMVACARYLCEKMSRRFFRPWAQIAFSELIHYRLPYLCCDMVFEHLTNTDLLHICLAAEGNSSA